MYVHTTEQISKSIYYAALLCLRASITQRVWRPASLPAAVLSFFFYFISTLVLASYTHRHVLCSSLNWEIVARWCMQNLTTCMCGLKLGYACRFCMQSYNHHADPSVCGRLKKEPYLPTAAERRERAANASRTRRGRVANTLCLYQIITVQWWRLLRGVFALRPQWIG